MDLKIDIDYKKDFDINKKNKLRDFLLSKLSIIGFVEIPSGHTSLDCVVVSPKIIEYSELELKRLTEHRNFLNRKIATLKKASLRNVKTLIK